MSASYPSDELPKFLFDVGKERFTEPNQGGFRDFDLVSDSNLQDRFRRIVLDRLVRVQHAVVAGQRAAQHSHLVQRIAILSAPVPSRM
jgi:hypothetical protein